MLKKSKIVNTFAMRSEKLKGLKNMGFTKWTEFLRQARRKN